MTTVSLSLMINRTNKVITSETRGYVKSNRIFINCKLCFVSLTHDDFDTGDRARYIVRRTEVLVIINLSCCLLKLFTD